MGEGWFAFRLGFLGDFEKLLVALALGVVFLAVVLELGGCLLKVLAALV